MSELEPALARSSPLLRAPLEAALEGREVSVGEATSLLAATGPDLQALLLTADHLTERQCGQQVGYVVNRNINFTNVCVKTCKFCAFSRDLRSEQGYLLSIPEIVRRVLEAERLGATEVCLQAGLLPEARSGLYLEICRAVREAAPAIHIHAFSPEEVRYAASMSRLSVRELLRELKQAGLDTMPGTSAEILDDSVRERIAPGRLSSSQWLEVIRTAHELGIRTTSTMMFGHVESLAQRAAHMALLRAVQKETSGFSEFVPLSFVHAEAPLFLRGELGEGAHGPSSQDVSRLYAVARLMLGATFKNIQASWVKQGLPAAAALLRAGANDLGGTLMNESISTAAGAQHGQLARPSTLRAAIRGAGREPVQRSTKYEILRSFTAAGTERPEPLDLVDAEHTFGSFRGLLADPRFRYEPRPRRAP